MTIGFFLEVIYFYFHRPNQEVKRDFMTIARHPSGKH